MKHKSEDYRLNSKPCFSADELERLKSRLDNLKNFSRDRSLSVMFPEVAAQLHPTLNGNISADMIPATYRRHFIWKCPVNPEEHIWKATLVNRTAGSKTGCPFCKNRKADSMSSLAVLRPDLAIEWNFDGNGRLGPEQVVPTSELIVSWRCKDDASHVWDAMIVQRNRGFLNCPYCSGKYVTDANRLSLLFPEISAEFHRKRNRMLYPKHEVNRAFFSQNKRMPPEERPEKNRRLRASDLAFDTCEVVWWFCSKDSKHEDWQATVRSRAHGDGCPSCSSRRVAEHDSLAATYPKLSKMFHPTRNAPAIASRVSRASGRIFWWQCLRDRTHVFPSRVFSMVRSWRNGKTGCAVCSHRRVGPNTSLAAVHPEVAALFLHTLDEKLSAEEVSANSNRLGVFQCNVSEDHVWTTKILNVVQSFKKRSRNGCPFCYGVRVTPKDSLAGLYPTVAKHLDRRTDPTLKASQISPGSHDSVHFRCLIDDSHRWRACVRAIVRRFKQGKLVCPQCQEERTGSR